jgi:ERCC4-related helicase
MTGQISPEKRREAWRSKRVFYVTPQILTNDISRQACDAKSIVCLVVDEAHRALGNYAYCTVVKAIASATRHFRILALSATPGCASLPLNLLSTWERSLTLLLCPANMEQVQQVIHNLLISNLEVRTSEDIDVRAYIHSTKLEMVRLSLTPELNAARSLFIELLKIPLDKLHNMRAFWTNEPEKVRAGQTSCCLVRACACACCVCVCVVSYVSCVSCVCGVCRVCAVCSHICIYIYIYIFSPNQASRFLLLDAKRKFEGHPSPAIPPNAYGQVHSQFALAITLYHAWGLLNTYGFRATKNYLSGTYPL